MKTEERKVRQGLQHALRRRGYTKHAIKRSHRARGATPVSKTSHTVAANGTVKCDFIEKEGHTLHKRHSAGLDSANESRSSSSHPTDQHHHPSALTWAA